MRAVSRAVVLGIAVLGVAALTMAQGPSRGTLDMYLIDVEGGNATLFVTPGRESLLIDTGNGGNAAARDADRIMAAVKEAGLTQIDHLITTHYHGDHYGAMAELTARIPVRNFIDHGASVEGANPFVDKIYPGLYAKAAHTVVKRGDRIAIKGIEVRIPSAGGQAITSALSGRAGTNPYCAAFTPQADDPGENAQSVGTHITYGRFRTLHLGDLTVNKEFNLMCPVNRIGTVDLFVVSHHGQASSNSEVLVHAIQPRVALVNNGVRKGGQPEAMRVLFSAPGREDIWQLHASQLSGQEHTVPGLFIANLVDQPLDAMPVAPLTTPARGTPGATPAPAHNGPAYWIKVAASQDGSFTVTNQRNGFSKTYAARSN